VHDGVVEAALETGATPLPARFGQRFENDDACRIALGGRAAAVGSLLAALQGRVEMTLIITPSTRRMLRELQPVWPDLVDDAARGDAARHGADATGMDAEGRGAGRRYLETLRAREAATGAVRRAIDELEQRLEAAARPFTQRTAVHEQLAKAPPLRTLSHLVPREAVDRYKAAVGSVPAGGEFRFLVIGPRAPYSFCELDPGKGSSGTHGMKLAD
jgi:hypothetical protein